MKDIFTILIFVLCITSATSQIDTLQYLPEVILSDIKLQKHSTGVSIHTITDSIIKGSKTSLTEILSANSLIYFKDNGPGGVSSPSFRGTSAQQTAVVWNGINVNSQLTGQTDFNTISSRNYSNITVRSGGGSIIYGSGAVGGSVHLENKISFNKANTTSIIAGYGSFNTKVAAAKTIVAKEKIYVDLGVDYQSSDNDFKYLESDRRNENGSFENLDASLNFGYTLSSSLVSKNVVKFHHNTYVGDRNFSGTLTAPSDDAYEDRTSKTLAIWDQKRSDYKGSLKIGHIFEQFKYFANNDNKDQYSLGKSSRYVAHYDGAIRIDNSKNLTLSGEFNAISGDGSSIEKSSRKSTSAIALWKHRLNDQLNYELQMRQEFIDNYKSPFLLSLGVEYAFAKANKNPRYILSLNASRNYRIPTFNDLYWEGAGSMGNINLLPETSLQVDVGQKLNFKEVLLDLRGYYIQTKDLIRWQPNTSGIWIPVNIADAKHYGIEFSGTYHIQLGKHYFETDVRYGHTIAKDISTNKQLIYVPKHKATFSITHRYNWIQFFAQNIVQSNVFTTSDHTATVKGYYLIHTGLTASILNKKNNKMSITARLNNALNTNYETVAFRPNPGQNLLIQTTYTF
ncbi:TonB-dependent receptor plug domain-containing protein [Dokdonia sp. Hel_I_53]|uniref:TonB-dependent receptor plug domain-containing protein n=1 Tax=Dokdonia sp. Hel_I_53 TaxID=1566287 RepID=UPI001198FF3A|nr:TonB-dependent receptor [Dokdonia sp. Hel_I_53]TVZ51026.1 iron complex outermembrane receptor protein [Dokdonia sp. Hel_I_53]